MAATVTTDQIYDYLEKLVAEDKLSSGDVTSMRQVQWVCTVLMRAAQANGDGRHGAALHVPRVARC